MTSVLDKLTESRRLTLFLDFHGYTAQSNAFTYGVKNQDVPMNTCEGRFPVIMGRMCDFFDVTESISFDKREYPTTMRVALHHRYVIPFAYTLEMSFGAIEIGSESGKQMGTRHYQRIGEVTVDAIGQMLQMGRRCANAFKKIGSSALSFYDNV